MKKQYDLRGFLPLLPEFTQLSLNQQKKVLTRYAPGLDYYMRQLQALGIVHMGTVVDAGCGYGQWAIAAALLNHRVVAIDHNPRCFPILLSVARHLGLEHKIIWLQGSLEDLPLKSISVDSVLSMEVLYFVGEQRTVREFARVCKQGSRIVILSIGIGHYLENIWIALRRFDQHTFFEYLGYVGRTLLYNKMRLGRRLNSMFQTRGQLRRIFRKEGLMESNFEPGGLLLESALERPLRRAYFFGFHSWLLIGRFLI